ncbi:conserved hypothetical protein [delta proteobacterium NaphS2]|nr:conserved hypothetical protein [delta proteobacterium NaphS2]
MESKRFHFSNFVVDSERKGSKRPVGQKTLWRGIVLKVSNFHVVFDLILIIKDKRDIIYITVNHKNRYHYRHRCK